MKAEGSQLVRRKTHGK